MHNKLEEVMEILHKRFGIFNFSVQPHNHPGEIHDKDITIKILEKEKLPEIIKFIMDNFYKNKDWSYKKE